MSLPGLGFGNTAFTALDIPFSSFLADMGTGVDFESVGAISVGISGSSVPSLDAQLDSIVAIVPEPGTLPLLGAGLGGLAALGRRRRAGRSSPLRARASARASGRACRPTPPRRSSTRARGRRAGTT